MKTFNEYVQESQVNEGIFDLEDNLKNGPQWQDLLVQWIIDNGGINIGGVGCDCLGRKIEPGDWVVFLDAGGHFGSGKRLNIGKAIAVKKQISIALFVPRKGSHYWSDSVERISRPSEYVFKISDPEKLAKEVV